MLILTMNYVAAIIMNKTRDDVRFSSIVSNLCVCSCISTCSSPVVFITTFVTFFALVIAITKDLPDVEGDRRYVLESCCVKVCKFFDSFICDVDSSFDLYFTLYMFVRTCLRIT